MRGLLCALCFSLSVVMLSACSAVVPGGSATAVWELAPQQTIDDSTTTVTMLVSRLGCNDGVTGTVNEPSVQVTDEQVIITVTVSPGEPLAANCQGNDQVAYELTLTESLGDRALIDGACTTTDAAATVFCESDVRYAP